MNKYQFYIGIDPGVVTGVCIWDRSIKRIYFLSSMKIHQAFEFIAGFKKSYPGLIMIRLEDARLRNWFEGTSVEKWQGAGSIKRDCKIWEDYLNDLNVPFQLVPPRANLTRLNENAFGKITGYHKQSNEHQRAAAMLVFGIY